ncbi:MAG: ATP-binding protein [Dysgonamonadaceae bacterium]|jgi:AAA+ ATPase superfamily predicted ATPase|nr:ATP-binding protein [Dysgonamonadaceae bacterium]
MFKFVDRISEQERLKKTFNRRNATFVVLYGRRRCGKSRLIRQVLLPDDIYFMADQSEATQQRVLLSKIIAGTISGFDRIIYPDWETLFDNLNVRLQKKITFCIDEFPYLVKSAPELPSVLQKILDNKNALKFNLLICGSSQQLMYGLVMDSFAPLFGRADEIIKIKPMQTPYLQEVLSCTPAEAIEEYSIWGGVPRYWELRSTEKDLFSALKHHLFNSQGILYDEPVRLFLDEMRDTAHSFTILSLVASGCNRLSEIAGRLEKPATHLSAPLEKLLNLGYLEREIPFGENYKNSKKSLYKIADPFLNFYFKNVVPNRSYIETEQIETIIEQIKTHFSEHVSSTWEKLCRQVIPFLNINGITFKPAMRWWGKTKNREMEIDVVSESVDGKYLLVGECKWNEKIYHTGQLLKTLNEKSKDLPFAEGKKIVPILFLKKSDSKTDGIYYPEDVLLHLK